MSVPANEPIRVVIVDDQALLREGFQRLLEMDNDGIVVAATASNGQAALDELARLAQAGTPADVVLMDVRIANVRSSIIWAWAPATARSAKPSSSPKAP
jgi:DNA-binding NarL/FixJ family response regulator